MVDKPTDVSSHRTSQYFTEENRRVFATLLGIEITHKKFFQLFIQPTHPFDNISIERTIFICRFNANCMPNAIMHIKMQGYSVKRIINLMGAINVG